MKFGGAKERCLLAALVVRRGEVVSDPYLVDALWGDHPPRTASKTLQNYVLRVRHALIGVEGLSIVTQPTGYSLQVPTGLVDAGLAESLIVEGRREKAAGNFAAAGRLLRRALDLWRGSALQEFADRPFAAAEALRLAELRDAALEDFLDTQLAVGRHHELVGELEALVTDGPLRERRWSQLMVALYRDGRQAEALEAFHRLRRTLTRDLGVVPSAPLRQLYEEILHQSPQLAWQSPGLTAQASPQTYFGRVPEMSRLFDRFEQASAGRGGVVLLAGEPGIGKTHALHELIALGRSRLATVLVGRCVEGAWAPPFRPFAEAISAYGDTVDAARLRADLGSVGSPLVRIAPRLSDLLPDLSPLPTLQPDEERFRLLDAAVRFFRALSAHAPVLLVLEDLHWADASSAMMLRHVARNCERHRLLIAGAYRTTETVTTDAATQHPLGDVLGALRSETECATIRLQALDATSVGQLLSAEAEAPVSASLISAIAAQTGGNPFFAKEMMRHLVEERALYEDSSGALETRLPLVAVPEGVRQVLARRCARLSAAANRLLESASGFPGPFLFPVAAVVADLDDTASLSALDELLAAGMVRPDEVAERYDFGHALVRYAIHDALNPSRQARLHRRLAHALEDARATTPSAADPAEIVAQYARSAALPGAAAGAVVAIEAADLAQAAGAHEAAVAFLRTATDLAGQDDVQLTRVRARLGLALAWALHFDEAVGVARDAAQRIEHRDGPSGAADYLAHVTSALGAAGSSAHAWMLAPAGLAYAGSSRGQAWAALTLLDLDRKEAADPDYVGIPLDHPRRREAFATLYRSSPVVSRGVDLTRSAVAAIYGGRDRVPADAAQDPTVLLYLLGALAPAVPGFERAAAEAHGRGELAREVHCHASIARARAALGELQPAREKLDQARELADRIPGRGWSWERIHVVGARDALIEATDEGWEGLQPVWDELAGAEDPVLRWARAPMRAGCAKSSARLGHGERAMSMLALPVRALGRAPAWSLNYTRVASDTAETLWLLDRRDHLRAVETALRLKALPADFRFPMMDIRLSLARLCALDGRLDEANDWFGQARSVLEEQGARPLRAVVDYDEALMYARAGRSTRARPPLDAAIAAFELIGMAGWLRRAAELDASLS